MDHFSLPAHYLNMVTLPRLLALVLVGSFGSACSSRDTLLDGGTAGATVGGTQASGGIGGAAPMGGKTGVGGVQHATGGATPAGGTASATGGASPAMGGSAAAGASSEMGGAAGEASGGAAAGGAASCGLPEGCPPCSDLKTQDECTAQAGCHPVFVEPNACGCAPAGCCTLFSRCADGAQAECALPAQFTCTVVMPRCDAPAYVIAYENGCYSGCVRPSDCAP